MDDETKAAIDKAIDARLANYVKANSWWQTYRRENPLAVQNILAFGCLALGIALGRFWAWILV